MKRLLLIEKEKGCKGQKTLNSLVFLFMAVVFCLQLSQNSFTKRTTDGRASSR